jgi:hypothetical protein
VAKWYSRPIIKWNLHNIDCACYFEFKLTAIIQVPLFPGILENSKRLLFWLKSYRQSTVLTDMQGHYLPTVNTCFPLLSDCLGHKACKQKMTHWTTDNRTCWRSGAATRRSTVSIWARTSAILRLVVVFSVLPGKFWDNTMIKPLVCPSKCFEIDHSPISLPFDNILWHVDPFLGNARNTLMQQ